MSGFVTVCSVLQCPGGGSSSGGFCTRALIVASPQCGGKGRLAAPCPPAWGIHGGRATLHGWRCSRSGDLTLPHLPSLLQTIARHGIGWGGGRGGQRRDETAGLGLGQPLSHSCALAEGITFLSYFHCVLPAFLVLEQCWGIHVLCPCLHWSGEQGDLDQNRRGGKDTKSGICCARLLLESPPYSNAR